ncbi:GNAT family N-acetyltransferase [Mycobacterium marinum]|uniref:GNAT family N-acetyltransferase n=1 Tax=Mycobacterium marinum TaxID=1781 RepID=UPI0035690E7A
MEISIEPFRADDAQSVQVLFVDALSSYYGGDHIAHFNRLMKAYENDNIDEFGYNSTEQSGYVARCIRSNAVVGFINLVIKRQCTAKISPILTSPEVRGNGIGHRLLARAFEVLADTAVRNIYCTVSKRNRTAVDFLMREGFRVVGSSRDQYLKGQCELVLQRPTIVGELVSGSTDVSLMRVEADAHWREIEDGAGLFTSNESVDRPISDIRIAARRDPSDVESKPKIAYLGHRGSELVGVLVLCPKKGGSTKLSTVLWKDEAALRALLKKVVTLDEFVSTKGRVYVHMPMESILVQVMQECAWRLDAVIPGAESDQMVIGQWSTNFLDPKCFVQPEWADYHSELQEVILERGWRKFETPQELIISLMAEVGELAQELQWKSHDGILGLDISAIASELPDIYNYLLRLAWHLDIDLLHACFDKIEKVRKKYPAPPAVLDSRLSYIS